MLSTKLRDNSNLQLCDGQVLVNINDSPNSILLLRSTASRGDSQCFCKHSEEDVLESVFECWNRTLRRFARNDILIILFVPFPPACGERLLCRRSRRCFLSFFCSFFFFISWNESHPIFTVHLPSTVDYVCRMHNAAARSRAAIFSKRFRNQCLESVAYAHGMHTRNTFVSNRLN